MAAPTIAPISVSLEGFSGSGRVATPALLGAMLRAAEKISDLIFSAARSIAPSRAGVATLPLPEKPSNETEIGAMVGAAIRPHTPGIARTTEREESSAT